MTRRDAWEDGEVVTEVTWYRGADLLWKLYLLTKKQCEHTHGLGRLVQPFPTSFLSTTAVSV